MGKLLIQKLQQYSLAFQKEKWILSNENEEMALQTLTEKNGAKGIKWNTDEPYIGLIRLLIRRIRWYYVLRGRWK